MGLNILVTGASGFVGSRLIPFLEKHGHNVIKGDRNADWGPQLEGCNAVVHLAAKVHVLQATNQDGNAFVEDNVLATQNLLEQASSAGVYRFIFLSTIGVHGNSSKAPLTESSPPKIDGPYAASKWHAEQVIQSSRAPQVITVRPPLVYGPGVKANFLRLLEATAQGQALPFGAVNNQRDYISVHNLCDAIHTLVTHEDAEGAYLIRDGEALSTPELVRRLAKHLDTEPNLLSIPSWLLKIGAYLTGKGTLYRSVCGTRSIDDSKLRSLGWKPPQTVDDALRETAEWYKENQT